MRKRKKHNLELVGDNEKIVLKLQESVKEMPKTLVDYTNSLRPSETNFE